MTDDRLHDKHEPRLQSGKLYSLLDIMGATITCDECGAWQNLPALHEVFAVEEARKRGWQTGDGKPDLCKHCLSRAPSEQDSTQGGSGAE